MVDAIEILQSDTGRAAAFRALANTPTFLPAADYEKLQGHLEDCEHLRRPGSTLLAYVIANKLLNTHAMANRPYIDLVIGGSLVSYAVNGQAKGPSLLAHRARPEMLDGVIAVSSLLGATLIGMRVGERAPLLGEDGGIATLLVTAVDQTSCAAAGALTSGHHRSADHAD